MPFAYAICFSKSSVVLCPLHPPFSRFICHIETFSCLNSHVFQLNQFVIFQSMVSRYKIPDLNYCFSSHEFIMLNYVLYAIKHIFCLEKK